MPFFNHMTLRRLLLAATVVGGPLLLARPIPATAQVVGVSIDIAPPALPTYVQPAMPDVGYIWTPGYWAYGQVGYYWVPGTWIQPPTPGVLWTPPYWAWTVSGYLFHQGYWGPHVGFYGGINYGYGYGGSGYDGGHWDHGTFTYNRTVNNFGSVHVANAYDRTVTVINRTAVSYSGGTGGLRSEPTAEDRLAEHDAHVAATAQQTAHASIAANNPALAASHNNGHPAVAATSRPAEPATSAAPHPAGPNTAARTNGPAGAAHPPERAAGPAAAAHPAEHAGPSAPGNVHASVAPAAEHAAVHPAAAHPAAPHAAPAHEEAHEAKK